MFELVERWIKSFVNIWEFFLHTLNFWVILNFAFLKSFNFRLNLSEVGFPPLYVLLSLHQEYLLLFIMLFNCLCQRVFSILEHLDHELQFLIEFWDSILLLLHQLLFYFEDVIFEYLRLLKRSLDFLVQGQLFFDCWVDFILGFEYVVAYPVALVLSDNAFRADIYLVILTEVLCLLLRMPKTELVNKALLGLLPGLPLFASLAWAAVCMERRTDSSKLVNLFLVVNVIQYSEVFY